MSVYQEQLEVLDNPKPSSVNESQEYHDQELKTIIQKGKRRFHSLYGWLLVFALGFIFLIAVAVVISVMWHYLAPTGGDGMPDLTWLEDSQLVKLQSMLFSGVLGAILPVIVKKIID